MIETIQSTASRWASAYHRFWFAPTDPLVVSVLRWFVGGMLFYTVLVWGVDLEAFFLRDGGWQSEALVEQLQRDDWAQSLWWMVPDEWIWPFHFTCLFTVGLFWVGLGTRVTKWLALAIIISYANRVPLANYGLDQINVMLCLYLCLGPCGRRLSVDSWIRRRVTSGNEKADVAPPSPMACLSIRMIQVHMCVIYFCAGLSKLQGVSWWNGEAVWRAAANYEYQQFSLTWMAEVPWLYQVSTIGTWVWEISFAFLVWNRFSRLPVLLIGLSMHIGIGMFMGMWTFGLIMCFAYLSFVPTAMLGKLLSTLRILPSWQPEPSVETESVGVANEDQNSHPVTAEAVPKSTAAEYWTPNTVVLVDSHLRHRHRISEDLQTLGFQCIGVDGWPEALRVHEALSACCVLCNASRTPQSELDYWVSQIPASRKGDTTVPRCIALERPDRRKLVPSAESRLVTADLSISKEELGALLTGHVSMRHSDRQGSELLIYSEPAENESEKSDSPTTFTS